MLLIPDLMQLYFIIFNLMRSNIMLLPTFAIQPLLHLNKYFYVLPKRKVVKRMLVYFLFEGGRTIFTKY